MREPASELRRVSMASKGEPQAFVLIGIGAAIIVGCTLLPALQRYGLDFLVPSSSKQLHLTEQQYDAFLAEHRFIVIGGPHRGGTTLMWQLLRSHPAVGSFPERVASDFSEGSFLQTVLPTFGVGNELQMGSGGVNAKPMGLGRYAFSPDAHMTETHALNTRANSRQLLSQWGYYWNTSRPVLLEKTPTDMLTSRLLQALLSPPPRQQTSFVFLTRHPLAVALAHMRWPACRHQSVGSLALHWLVSHRVLASDLPHLRAARVVRYEDLARDPTACMHELIAWLQLPGSLPVHTSDRVVRDTNAKYERRYCTEHLASARQRREHCAMGAALQPAIARLGLGYDLHAAGSEHGFSCLATHLHSAGCEPVAPAAALVRGLEMLTRRLSSGGGPPPALGGEHLICGKVEQPQPQRRHRGRRSDHEHRVESGAAQTRRGGRRRRKLQIIGTKGEKVTSEKVAI